MDFERRKLESWQMAYGFFSQKDRRLAAADAWIPDDGTESGRRIGRLAISVEDIDKLKARGQNTVVAQLQSILLPGLMLSRHVFQGLRRPMLCNGERDADAKKLVYSRKPALDVRIKGNARDGFISAQCQPPDAQVFCVIVSPKLHLREAFPDVDGWIDHWSWVKEDLGLTEAPRSWIERYDRKLFTIHDSERISE
jgi:hypothetical protein